MGTNPRTIPRVCEHCGASFMASAREVKRGNGRFCSLQCAGASRRKPVECTCATCGKIFTTEPNRVAAGRGVYCSQECQYQSKRSPIVQCACATCGKVFECKEHEARRRTYCSNACRRVGTGIKSLQRYADPSYRKKWQEGIDRRSASDEWRRRQKEGSQERSQTEEYKVLNRAGLQRRQAGARWWNSMRDNPMWQRGEKNPNWKGAQTQRQVEYGRSEYTQWRTVVFERDDYTCQQCHKRGGSLHAHHVKQWSEYPDLRYEISNGITLCAHCHSELHGHYIPGRFPKDRKR